MTTKSLNPRDTTRILNLAKAIKKNAAGDSVSYLTFTDSARLDEIIDIAKAIDARETRRDPSLRRKPAKKRRVLKAEAKA